MGARALYYYSDLTLSQSFQLMAAQLSKKATLPLAKILLQCHVTVVKQGPVFKGSGEYSCMALF